MKTVKSQPASSTAGANLLFANHGRAKHKQPKWSKTTYINDTTQHVLDARDPFTRTCTASGGAIAEMQAVRNRIAHRNPASQKSYSTVVRRHYGARLNHVTPGLLLLSDRFKPSLLETYIASCATIVKECCQA